MATPARTEQPARRRLLLTEEEAADLIGYAPETLAKWRVVGGGPAFVTGRKVGYFEEDLVAWARERRVSSTAEAKKKFSPKKRRPEPEEPKPQ